MKTNFTKNEKRKQIFTKKGRDIFFQFSKNEKINEKFK